jgi:tetratricopeptide (TPR) repeat protein
MERGNQQGRPMPRLAHLTVLERPSKVRASAPAPPAPAEASRYFAFLSYSHSDEAVARWLHAELEHFRVPDTLVGRVTDNGIVPKRLTPVFRDRGELAASDDLGAELRAAIEASRFLIVLCSPAAAASRWANAEVETFKRSRPRGCVFAAIVDGEPFASDRPGREADECLPRALRVHFDRRGRPTTRRAEPMAADLREGGDGRRLGFLKNVAGMLGIGLDELVQRDTMRRQRRMGLLAAASLAGMAVTSTLAVTAIQARDAASEQRREAEGLVGFMLGDLRDKLEPIGRLDALDAVGTRALDYFEKQDKATLSDAALAQQARALSMLGDIATARGDTAGALQRYREAMAGTAEMVRRAPDDPQRLFDHAQNVFYVGQIAVNAGHLDQGEAAMREYKRLASRMVALEPDNLKWRMEAKYADSNLGTVLFKQRRFAEASAQLQQAAVTADSLAAADPNNQDYQQSLPESLAWLGDSLFAEGRLDEAIAKRERQVALLESLRHRFPLDVGYQQRAIPAHRALGRWLGSSGGTAAGLEHSRAAVAIGQQLIPTEPDNMLWVRYTAAAQLDLARALLANGSVDEPAIQTRSACDLADRLANRDRDNLDSQAVAIDCLAVRARLAIAEGSTGEALALANRMLSAARTIGASNPADRAIMVSTAYELIGDAHQRRGDRQSAQASWRAGLAAWPKGVNETPREMAIHAELLRSAGLASQAKPLTDRLAAIGYRRLI